MQTVHIKQHTIVGAEITRTIADAIHQAEAENCRVAFEFNGVEITVKGDSDPALIHRDWHRAMQGMVESNKVGPHPGVLTEAEIANDARVKAENDARRVERERKWLREAEVGRATADAALADAPVFALADPEGWQRGLDKNTDPYGRCCVSVAPPPPSGA